MNKNIKKLIIVGAALMTLSSIMLTIEKVSYGPEVDALKMKEESLLEERIAIESEIEKKSSTQGIVEKSAELGFSKPNNIFYLSDLENLASAR